MNRLRPSLPLPLEAWTRRRPMRVLCDHGAPAPLIPYLADHAVTKAKDAGWDRLTNGELLTAAETAEFEVFLTTDKNMRYQQSLIGRKIAVILIGKQQWPDVKPHVRRVLDAVATAIPGSYTEVEIPYSRNRSTLSTSRSHRSGHLIQKS